MLFRSVKTLDNENTQEIRIFDTKVHTVLYEEYCVHLRELSWKEGLQIDANSFRKNGENIYISSEHEKREIISKALVGITKDNQKVDFNFSELSHKFVEDIWLIYQKYLQTLQEKNLVYRCFCTPEELEVRRNRQIAMKKPSRYEGTCLKLSAEQIQEKLDKKTDGKKTQKGELK